MTTQKYNTNAWVFAWDLIKLKGRSNNTRPASFICMYMAIPFTRLCHCATQTTDNTIIIYVDRYDRFRNVSLNWDWKLNCWYFWSGLISNKHLFWNIYSSNLFIRSLPSRVNSSVAQGLFVRLGWAWDAQNLKDNDCSINTSDKTKTLKQKLKTIYIYLYLKH